MFINRAELKTDAKNALRGKWGLSIGLQVILYLIFMVAGVIIGLVGIVLKFAEAPFLSLIAEFLVIPAFMLGYKIFFLRISRFDDVEVKTLFSGFPNFWKAFGLYFMVGLFIFLWSLLLIVPGIIAVLRYSMASFILADKPEIGVIAAIRESKRITAGHKFDIFVLYLSFIGWNILAGLTVIGNLWLMPYKNTTFANLYNQLSGQADQPLHD